MDDQTNDHFLQAIPEESSYNTNSVALSPSQDSIGSLDGTHFWSISLDDTPILPAIDGKKVKSFEELVEEALKRDESPANLDDSDKPKKPYLKKGTGLTRFAPKPDEPKRERRNCCKKKLEQQFRSEAEKCIQKSDQCCPRKLDHTKTNGSAQSKKVTMKSAPQVNKRSESHNSEIRNGLNRFSVEPKKVQPNRRPLSGQSLSNVILSQYSSDFEPIQQKKNNVISHGLLSMESNTKSPKISTKDKKVNFEDDEPRVVALERILKNIRMKQSKLQQLQELESDEDSWVDEYDEPEVIGKDARIKNLSKSKINKKLTRTGTFTLGKTNLTKDAEPNPLSAPKVSNYTLSLKRKIETLENQLHQLTAKCQQNIADYKSCGAPSEEKFSPEKFFSEMNEIKKHLFSLSNKLETIETKLLTKESQTQGLKINLPSSSSKVLTSPETSLYSQIQQLQTGTHLTLSNGDQIMKTSDNTIIYSYISGVRQITYTDGTRVVEFPSGQIERVGTNGTKTIFYPNGTQRVIRPDGSEETITPDGTVIRVSVDGTEIIELSNGEREIRTGEFKRREYLDGTIKTIHVDGTEETRFANGRLRIKDKEGNLIADSLITQFKGLT